MEEERVYYNDEWNNITKKLLTKTGNMTFPELNKYFDSFRELSCQCNLPKPNSFTGNCIVCNKVIKPIIDKDVNKYRK